MSGIYCGNNALEPKLISGELNLGTKYKCLQKGIMKGRGLPKYEHNYQKIDNRKIYCGKSNILPQGYDYLGNLPMCLNKGIGIGKARFSFIDHQNNIKFYLKIFGLSSFLLSVLLYYIRPNLLLKYNKITNKKNIVWWKLIVLSILKSLFITLIVYIVIN